MSYIEEVKHAISNECYDCGGYNTERKNGELFCIDCICGFVEK